MVVVGVEYIVVIIVSGKLYGWGWGCYGNLGFGDCKDRLVFVEVVILNVCFYCILFMFLSIVFGFVVLRLKEVEFIF